MKKHKKMANKHVSFQITDVTDQVLDIDSEDFSGNNWTVEDLVNNDARFSIQNDIECAPNLCMEISDSIAAISGNFEAGGTPYELSSHDFCEVGERTTPGSGSWSIIGQFPIRRPH